ncbi:hypothetical protein V8E36_007394 [Tilletia maclaganii]
MERRTRPTSASRARSERGSKPNTRKASRQASEWQHEGEKREEASTSAPSAPPPEALMGPRTGSGYDERTYELVIVEQPTTGCAFGQQPLSRIPIFPALIARLRIFDREGVEVTAGDDLPFLTCQVSLLTEQGESADLVMGQSPTAQGDAEASTAPEPSTSRRRTTRRVSSRGGAAGRKTQAKAKAKAQSSGDDSFSSTDGPILAPTRMLAGDRPAHAEIYFDLDNQRRLLFIFSDVCIRLTGKYRLQLSLTRLPGSGHILPLPSVTLASAVTDLITVVERDAFQVLSKPNVP